MKENKDETKIKKEEKINDKKDNKEYFPIRKNITNNNNNKKSCITTNYINNGKQFKTKRLSARNSFIKEANKTNILGINKNDKISLNKTIGVNLGKPVIKKTNTVSNLNKIGKRNSLYLNSKKDNNNNLLNNRVRKSVILNNKINKPPEKRNSFIIQKHKNTLKISRKTSNKFLDEILEKNEDKKDNDNDEDNKNDKKNNNNDYKRAFSRKPTERERQKKLNKLNKDSFGAVAKYTKKATQFRKRDQRQKQGKIE